MLSNKVIVFDLDDTLCQEIDYLKSAYREIAQRMQVFISGKDLSEQMLRWYEMKENVFEKLEYLSEYRVTSTELLEWYRNHIPNVQLSFDTKDLLTYLVNQNATIGLITDGRSITQRNKIQALGLLEWISADNIIISEEFGSGKPALRNFQYFNDKFPEKQFYYIGDNLKKDFIAPNKLGWITICLKDKGRNIHTQNMTVDSLQAPSCLINDIDEILKYI